MSELLTTHPYNNDLRVALLQLNRPKVLNALTTDLLQEIVDELRRLDDLPEVRCIILTGNDKAFAAGADILKMSKSNPIEQLTDKRMRLWKEFAMISKPIIAAVNGFALGGGHELAMACDFVIAGDSAKFGQPEINIGTTPGAGGTQRLTRALGKSKAMMLALTGEMLSAMEAYECNLIAKVVPAKTLLLECFEVAKKIADKSPIAVKLTKDSINKSQELSLSDGLEYERRNFYLSFASADQKEGMSAFLEKRAPEYKGN
ncbi:enoyl-CoA hydratase-related protein [Halobacteriovorax marinus]|uniref:enoyl-CoA hydratase-related protein n=1 Tax=Halobacteriovorax marinus TaxID=97084 RepID=UPI003A8E23EA